MGQDYTPHAEVTDWFETLGISSLCQWDLLTFLYRHQTTLVGADNLARLLGYTTESIVTAMDTLASLGLVGRSRLSHGVRFYQFIMPSDSPRGDAFARLLALASHRASRLRLSKQLQRDDQPHAAGPQGARPIYTETRQVTRVVRLRSQEYESPEYGRKKGTWRKAI